MIWDQKPKDLNQKSKQNKSEYSKLKHFLVNKHTNFKHQKVKINSTYET
jgi:hypothetical protein